MSDEYVVEITEPLNPIKCANLMHPYLKKGEPVTPEFCRQLLRSSNHRKIMRDMLALIDARLEKILMTIGIIAKFYMAYSAAAGK